MSKEIFENNLKAMDKWYPRFADLIRKEKYTKDDAEINTELSWDGELIFRVRKGDKLLYLGGKRDARGIIDAWVENSYFDKMVRYAPVFLFGLGSGAYLKSTIANTNKKVNIVAYEPSVNIFLAMLNEVDISKEIEDRPIAFVVEGINGEEFGSIVSSMLVMENIEYLKSEPHPNYRIMYPDEIMDKMKILQGVASDILMNMYTNRNFQKDSPVNLFGNLKYICEGYNTFSLSQAVPYEGRTAILVSAGPSLNKNIHELKRAKNKAFILSVDTAIKPLINAGIKPDAFFTLDPKKPASLVEIDGAEDIPVIATADANNELLAHQKGPKIFFFDGEQIVWKIYLNNGVILRALDIGGSVACSALSLLYKMGFNKIILVGQDLAYTNNRSHADGTFNDKMPEENTKNGEFIMVKGNYEDEVPTITNLKKYLEWFEMYVKGMKAHRGTKVINATEGGAYIEGTEVKTLREAIDEWCGDEEIDFESCARNIKSSFTEEGIKSAFEYIYKIPEQYAEIARISKQLKKEYNKLDRLSRSNNISQDACRKQLHRIKKYTNKCHAIDGYTLMTYTMAFSEQMVRSEAFFEEATVEEEFKELARKGALYCDMTIQCADMLRDIAQEIICDNGGEVNAEQ